MKRCLIALVGIIVAAGAMAETADPSAVAEVESGARDTANAAWWGFNTEDATDALQSAINSKAPIVVVPYMAAPWVVRPIALRSNLTLIFEPGVEVIAKKDDFREKGHSLFTGRAVENVTMRGYGATLRMRKADYQASDYQPSEWRMAIRLMSCKNVIVEGLRVESSGGDGVYIGVDGSAQPWCEDITIRDAVFHDHHRQGISVISCDGLLIENCTLSNTDGTAPQAGIDFEPNNANERLVDCVVRNSTFVNNSGPGILLYLNHLTKESAPVSIRVENCYIAGNDDSGVRIGAINEDGPDGSIIFDNCTVEQSGSGIHLYDKAATSARVTFNNCRVSMSGPPEGKVQRQEAPIVMRVRRPDRAAMVGGIVLEKCAVWDEREMPWFQFKRDKDAGTLGDITGSVVLYAGSKSIELPEGVEPPDVAVTQAVHP